MVIQLALMRLTNTVIGCEFRLLASATLFTAPHVAATLSPLLRRIIFHCATAPRTLSHYLSHFQ
jgi:hypothetical protein